MNSFAVWAFSELLAMCTSKPNSSFSFRNLQPIKCYMCWSNPCSNGNTPSFSGSVLLLLWALLWDFIVVVVSFLWWCLCKDLTKLLNNRSSVFGKKSNSAPCCWPERGNFQCCMQTELQIAVGSCGGNAPFLQLLAFPLHFIPNIFHLIYKEPQTNAGSGYMTKAQNKI